MGTSKSAGQVTLRVNLTKKLAQKLEEEQKKNPDIGFQTFVNDYLERALRREEELQLADEFIEFLDVYDDTVVLKDKDINKTIGLQINGESRKLYCEHCKKVDCIHVGFAFGVHKVAKVLVDHGFKPPQKINRKAADE